MEFFFKFSLSPLPGGLPLKPFLDFHFLFLVLLGGGTFRAPCSLKFKIIFFIITHFKVMEFPPYSYEWNYLHWKPYQCTSQQQWRNCRYFQFNWTHSFRPQSHTRLYLMTFFLNKKKTVWAVSLRKRLKNKKKYLARSKWQNDFCYQQKRAKRSPIK